MSAFSVAVAVGASRPFALSDGGRPRWSAIVLIASASLRKKSISLAAPAAFLLLTGTHSSTPPLSACPVLPLSPRGTTTSLSWCWVNGCIWARPQPVVIASCPVISGWLPVAASVLLSRVGGQIAPVLRRPSQKVNH